LGGRNLAPVAKPRQRHRNAAHWWLTLWVPAHFAAYLEPMLLALAVTSS